MATEQAGGYSMALNLNDFASANKYYFDNISFTLNGEELIVNGDLDSDGWRGTPPVGLWTKEYRRKHVYAGFADGLAGAE